ncbi:MAG: type II toxin-antitoxin system HicB family antitoxin [bacterium]
MPKPKESSFRDYVREVLKNATYESDDSLGNIPCVVAEAPDLPGCFTQGENFEEARENLIDAIELWITAGLKNNEHMPTINGCRLAVEIDTIKQKTQEKQGVC